MSAVVLWSQCLTSRATAASVVQRFREIKFSRESSYWVIVWSCDHVIVWSCDCVIVWSCDRVIMWSCDHVIVLLSYLFRWHDLAFAGPQVSEMNSKMIRRCIILYIYTHIIIYSSEISLSSSEENKCSFSQNNISISLLSLGSPRPKTNSSVDLEAIDVPAWGRTNARVTWESHDVRTLGCRRVWRQGTVRCVPPACRVAWLPSYHGRHCNNTSAVCVC